ncbi:keratin, type I cytoskeletal 13-like isoform X2 [Myxocyprinus asiaticus]|uniref:keratin, type I cytoskeletal 13-like isoform X2 n=1 Tax=Myxocyprinus asiaticus TaxID=70543 RepID=UPI0022224A91|nr:keratin, type I cytoskeletal 13-like isoform X2 [Myxocyprinus asiaticus]
MSVIRSSKTFSTQSAFGSSSLGSSAGMVINGLGSSGVSLSFAGQKYGSSGGNGVRISRSMSTSSLVMPAYEVTLYANEKQTMQNLNDRLASYLERVRTLEHANMKLELQIKEFHDNKNPLKSKDMSGYFVTISELCTQGVIGEIKLSVGDLENQLTGLKDELLYIKKNHEENLHLLREQQSGSVNVEIDCTARSDLDKELQEMRAQYETLIEKKRREAEEWFHSKAEVLQTQVTTSCTEIKTSQTELTDLKRTFQSLEIELQGLLKMKHQLEQSVTDVGLCYAAQLSQLQLRIDYLEEELQKLNANMQYQASEYQLLLDIKMRLEMEIAEYRRLLDGEARATVINTSESSVTSTETVTKTVEIKEEEEHNPHVQRRVKVIVEELVDGQVVSTSVDEKLQEVN